MENFSNRLIALRKEHKLTQSDLASLLEKQRSTVSGYETMGKEPDFETLCFLSEYFEVTTDYLLGRSDERTHAASLFHNDSANFQKHYDALPPQLKAVIAELFDDFYVMLNRDMRANRGELLSLYRDLMRKLRSSRNEIKRIATGPEDMAAILPLLMEKENNLKNDVAMILDKLMEADLRR